MKEYAKILLEQAGFKEIGKFLFIRGEKLTGTRALLFTEKILICKGDDSERISYNELKQNLVKRGLLK